eukprot:6002000-Lingulodinium_polyedra.AAC.1
MCCGASWPWVTRACQRPFGRALNAGWRSVRFSVRPLHIIAQYDVAGRANVGGAQAWAILPR